MTDEELFIEALIVLENARCDQHDINFRVTWNQRKIRVKKELRERLEK